MTEKTEKREPIFAHMSPWEITLFALLSDIYDKQKSAKLARGVIDESIIDRAATALKKQTGWTYSYIHREWFRG